MSISKRDRSSRFLNAAVVLLVAFACIAGVAAAAFGANLASDTPAAIDANDNRTPAGTRSHGVLRISLDARNGYWYPSGPGHAGLLVEAFGEVGKPLRIPGPLLRVPLGTVVVATVRNSIPRTVLSVHGLVDRPGNGDRAFSVRFGQERVVQFRAAAPGSYYYWASTTGNSIGARFGQDSQLSGAIVVDDPHEKPNSLTDRIFVITEWAGVRGKKGFPDTRYQIEAFNGLNYPATERLSYERGTLVRWRLINASWEDHPLHLHAFYFDVLARGDGLHDRIYPANAYRERKVTELIPSGNTTTIAWLASRAGNWMFHCHLAYHIIETAPLSQLVNPRFNTAAWEHSGRMGGMVLRFTVRPKAGDPPIVTAAATRHLELLVERAPDDTPELPAFQYVLKENGTTTAGPGAAGPPIVLNQGQTVSINVTNDLDEATAVHWHGTELADAYYDGVAGFSGYGARLAPMIMPGMSFEAIFAPPRVGTFAYHTHMDDVWQLRAGLSGPLIVLPPGARFDPATDHIVQITTPRDHKDGASVYVNGVPNPPPMTLPAGVAHRFRLINMTTFQTGLIVSLVSAAGPVSWTPIAVDGADLPGPQRRPETAVQAVTIGQTRDFTFFPSAPGEYRLLFQTYLGDQIRVTVPVHVVP